MMSANDGSPGRKRISRRSQKPIIAVSRLLKSCATPPASWPTACIFCDWANWTSRFFCSVTSMTCSISPPSPPSAPSSRLRKTTPERSRVPLSLPSTAPGGVGGGGGLDGDVAAILLVDKADQRLADQLLRRRAKQFAERPVGLLKAAKAVDHRNADRGVGEKPLEPLARQAQRGLPFAFRG